MLITVTRQEAARLKYAAGRFATIYKRLSKSKQEKHKIGAANAEVSVIQFHNEIMGEFAMARFVSRKPHVYMTQLCRDDLRDALFTLNAMFKSLYPSKRPEAQSAYNKAKETLRHFVKLYDVEAKRRGGDA